MSNVSVTITDSAGTIVEAQQTTGVQLNPFIIPNYLSLASVSVGEFTSADGTTSFVGAYLFPVKMRTTPSYSYSAFADIQLYDLGGGADRGAATGSALIATVSSTNWAYVTFTGMSATTAGVTHLIRGDNTANARIKFSAEL